MSDIEKKKCTSIFILHRYYELRLRYKKAKYICTVHVYVNTAKETSSMSKHAENSNNKKCNEPLFNRIVEHNSLSKTILY